MYTIFVKFYKHLILYKLTRYAIVGVIATIIHLFIATIYIRYIHDDLLFSNVIGFILAYIFSYLMQSKYVFEHKVSLAKASKYFIVQFGALLISVFISDTLDDFNTYIKTIIVLVIMPIITFTTHKLWTFKD